MCKLLLPLSMAALICMSFVATRADDKPGKDHHDMPMAEMMKECKDHGKQVTAHLDMAAQTKGEEMLKHLNEAKEHMADCMAVMGMMKPAHKSDQMMQQCMEHAEQSNIHLYMTSRSHMAEKHDEKANNPAETKHHHEEEMMHLAQAKKHMGMCMDVMAKMMDKSGK